MYAKYELKEFISAQKNADLEISFSFLNKNISLYRKISTFKFFLSSSLSIFLSFIFCCLLVNLLDILPSFTNIVVLFFVGSIVFFLLTIIFDFLLEKYGFSILKKIPFIKNKVNNAIEGKNEWDKFINDPSKHYTMLCLMTKTYELLNTLHPTDNIIIDYRKNLLINFTSALKNKYGEYSLHIFYKFLSEYNAIENIT